MHKLIKKGLSVLLALAVVFSIIPVSAAAAVPMLKGYVTLSRNLVHAGDTIKVTLNLEGIPYTPKVLPNDVILVIDRSGSMANSISDMIVAAKEFVNSIDLGTHRIGIVAYESKAKVSPLTSNRSELISFLDSVNSAAGSTAMDLAINEAAGELNSNIRSSAIGSIVLMTDGIADNINAAKSAAASAKASGYYFYTVALCKSLTSTENQDLKTMATSETDHYSVFSSDKLSQAYDDIAQKIGDCNARDVVVTQTIDSHFTYVDGSADDSIPVPDITANNTVLTWTIPQLSKGISTLSYEIQPVQGCPMGTYTPADGDISYLDYTSNVTTVDLTSPIIQLKEFGPDITSISPRRSDGKSPVDVTITGINFDPAATVTFDGNTVSGAVVNSDTSISMTIPVCADGNYRIYVKNPDGQSDSIDFSVGPLPSVLSITPNQCNENESVRVKIRGANFKGNFRTLKVYVNGVEASVSSNNTVQINCDVPELPAGTYDVKVVNSDGGVVTATDAFTYLGTPPPPSPSISSVGPDDCFEGETASVKILGSNFRGTYKTIKVYIGGEEAKVTSNNTTSICCTVPAQAAGSYDVKVVNADGTTATLANGFSYVAPPPPVPPVITSISPDNCEEQSSVKITINGSGFVGSYSTIKVYVNGQSASVSSCNTVKITCTVPKLAAGTYDVKVVNADSGTATLPSAFTYIPLPPPEPPALKSITPNSCVEGTSVKAKIYGSGIVGNYKTLKVYIGGEEAKVTSNNTTLINVDTPVLAAGTYDVKVVNSDSGTATLTGAFTCTPKDPPVQPEITGISSASCYENTTASIKITGTGFNGNYKTIKVYIGSEEATVTSCNTTSINCTVPAQAAGTYDVTVENADGTTIERSDGFTYTVKPKSVPVISRLSVSSIKANKSGQKIKIYGSNFKGSFRTLKVRIGGVPCKVTSNNTTLINVTVPSIPAGNLTVEVENSDGGIGTWRSTLLCI